jgi:hypothetical protein
MEDAMARRKPWSNNVSRVELDHRARDARVRLVRLERLLVQRTAAAGSWLSPVVRLLGFRVYGNGRKEDQITGSLSKPRGGSMLETDSTGFDGCSAVCCG